MTDCTHRRYTTIKTRGYSHPVAKRPFTEENPSAHGCITDTEECKACGARRSVNINGAHSEYSPWGPSQEARVRQALDEANANLDPLGLRLLDVSPGEHDDFAVSATLRGQPLRSAWLHRDIAPAAAQDDDGDGVIPLYRAIRDAARSVAAAY